MAKITRDEVLKIAAMSKIAIKEDEIAIISKQLEDVLTYAERVRVVANVQQTEQLYKNVNVMRDDVIVPTDYKPIIEQAPLSIDNYFVVPKILETE